MNKANTATERMGNPIVERWELQVEGKLRSPLLVGSGETEHSDMDVVMDRQGRPFIPGTAVAGALRNYLAVYKEEEAKALFGTAEEAGKQSALFVYDVLLRNPHGREVQANNSMHSKSQHLAKAQVVIRDGVKLDAHKTALDTAKYDMQVVQTGTACTLRMSLVLREKDADLKSYGEDQGKPRGVLLVEGLLAALNSGDCRIGAKSNRGFGHVELCHIYERCFHMDDADEFQQWLTFDPHKIRKPFGEYELLPENLHSMGSSPFHCMEVPLALEGTLLVRDVRVALDEGVADCEQLHIMKGGRAHAVIPGSTWMGALRGRIAAMVVQLTGLKFADAQQALAPFFGTWINASTREAHNDLRPSQIWVEETQVEGGHFLPISRTAIDRFTGGAKNGALFTEKPWVQGTAQLRLHWRDTQNADCVTGLLLWAVCDLAEGLLAVGGETAVGRGVFQLCGNVQLDQKPLIHFRSGGWKCEDVCEPYFKAARDWCETIKEQASQNGDTYNGR